jgi:hypothetical protein
LKSGARIDDADRYSQTACHVAALHGFVEVLALLLAHRPNLGLEDHAQRTPLHRAFISNDSPDERIVSMLIEAGAPLDGFAKLELCKLCIVSTSVIQALLVRGVIVSEVHDDDDMVTPLHTAARFSHDSTVLDMLVNVCGIDLEAETLDGETGLSVAAANANGDALRWFLEAGADVDHCFPVCFAENYECMVLLLAAGADVDEPSQLPGIDLPFNGLWKLDTEESPWFILHALIAAGMDIEVVSGGALSALVSELDNYDLDQVEVSERDIARVRLDFVRHRALQVCIGLQSLRLDALQMCEILVHSCGPLAHLIAYHQWWKIGSTVTHFKHS